MRASNLCLKGVICSHYKIFQAGQRLALAASGRDADEARKRNPAEALKTAKKRGESHLSAARFVRRFLIYLLLFGDANIINFNTRLCIGRIKPKLVDNASPSFNLGHIQ
jgi:hypothetical protein